jgi:hypothetical protein
LACGVTAKDINPVPEEACLAPAFVAFARKQAPDHWIEGALRDRLRQAPLLALRCVKPRRPPTAADGYAAPPPGAPLWSDALLGHDDFRCVSFVLVAYSGYSW